MSRANLRKTKVAVEGLECKGLTTGLSAQGALANIGSLTVARSPGLASVPGMPNPEEPNEPHRPIGPVSRASIIAI
jgi:hypothetical protein